MRIQYKHQKFQADAAKAVVDVFAGQPYLTPTYMMDRGSGYIQQSLTDDVDFTGWSNQKIVPELNDQLILEHLQKIQRTNQIAPSNKLEGRSNGFNLTIEMETGVGKTYTYIKTMYELNRAYGWSKFIIVVPSIAIREGVYKSFEMTQEHFAEEYGKKIRFFIYNSTQLTEIDRFASDSSINVMIINSQAFNAKGKDARRIYMKLDEFRSRRPIDIIAKTNPILIIDEPTAGLDPEERLHFYNLLVELAMQRIVILSTHIASDIEATCSDVAILCHGQIIFNGDIDILIQKAAGKIYTVTIFADELDDFKKQHTIISIHQHQKAITCRFICEKRPEPNWLACQPTLEDSYMYIMSKHKAREVE